MCVTMCSKSAGKNRKKLLRGIIHLSKKNDKWKSKQLKQRVVEIFCQEFSGCVATSVLIGLWLRVSSLTITIWDADFFVRYTQKKLKALLCAQRSRFMVIKVNLEIKLPLLLSLESFNMSSQIWNIICIIIIKIAWMPSLEKKTSLIAAV